MLFALAVACWVPVVWLQLRMLAIASRSARLAAELPKVFWQFSSWWRRLGYPAFAAMLIVTYLMVVKPAFPP